MKLHLGCGDKRLEGFINIDCRETSATDMIANVAILEDFDLNSIELIYACHVLEHFDRHEYKKVLKRWHEILKPAGILRLAIPDFGSIVKWYQKTGDLEPLRGLLYGAQNYAENYHHCCWDLKCLKNDLETVGFASIVPWEWRNVEHSSIDDYSQSYLPHMDKNNGTLMSLNLEATK